MWPRLLKVTNHGTTGVMQHTAALGLSPMYILPRTYDTRVDMSTEIGRYSIQVCSLSSYESQITSDSYPHILYGFVTYKFCYIFHNDLYILSLF